jgi:hypothetical protein
LIGIEPDAGAERDLKKVTVGGRSGLPGDRSHVRSEHLRIVGPFTPDLLPKVVLDQANVDLALQNGAEALALGVIGDAGELDVESSSLVPPGFLALSVTVALMSPARRTAESCA